MKVSSAHNPELSEILRLALVGRNIAFRALPAARNSVFFNFYVLDSFNVSLPPPPHPPFPPPPPHFFVVVVLFSFRRERKDCTILPGSDRRV